MRIPSEAAQNLLLDPLVLNCAWNKLQDWYAASSWEPMKDWSEWQMDPWPKIEMTARRLARGEYTPQEFRLVPVPKQGGAVRHYACPSVQDQFAFLVLGVILTPLLEIRMLKVSFGGRWYRRIRPDGVTERWKYTNQPYSLGDRRIYQSYSRSYGLFRRVAAWTAGRMLDLPIDANASLDPILTQADYPEDEIPYRDIEKCQAAAHCRLDLRAAYPCVSRTLFRNRLVNILRDPSAHLIGAFRAGSPWVALERQPEVANELAEIWADMLDDVRYSPGKIGGLWRPNLKMSPEISLPAEEADLGGIPTGLAVSSVMFNVYMNCIDRKVVGECGSDTAYLRFVDDIVFIAPSTGRIVELVDSLRAALRGPEDSNLGIGWSKTRPNEFGKFLADRASSESFVMEWQSLKRKAKDDISQAMNLDADFIGPFVTFLVERMSDLGSPTIHDYFGDQIGPRLVQLYELIHLGLDDNEVRLDTRLSFATARLSRAPVPSNYGPDDEGSRDYMRKATDQMLSAIVGAFKRVPWKTSIWRACLRVAFRGKCAGTPTGNPASPREGGDKDQVQDLFRLCSRAGDWSRKPWGDTPKPKVTAKSLRLCTSFLRASFWRELTRMAVDLGRLGRSPVRLRGPLHWSFVTIDNEQFDVDNWFTEVFTAAKHAFYPSRGPSPDHWWEVEAFDLAKEVYTKAVGLCGAVYLGLPANTSILISSMMTDAARGLFQLVGRPYWYELDEADIRGALSRVEVGCGVGDGLVRDPLSRFVALRDYAVVRQVAQALTPIPVVAWSGWLDRVDIAWEQNLANERSLTRLMASSVDGIQDPRDIPAVGLPSRAVLAILNGRNSDPPIDAADQVWWDWTFGEQLFSELSKLRSASLRRAFGEDPDPRDFELDVTLSPPQLSRGGELPPHPLFFLLHRVVPTANRATTNGVHLWDLLVALIAIAGSERLLDQIYSKYPLPVPLAERTNWRCLYPMPVSFWQALDFLLWGVSSTGEWETIQQNEVYEDWTRVDIRLNSGRTHGIFEVPVSMPSQIDAVAKDEFRIDPENLQQKDLVVRLGQVCEDLTQDALSSWQRPAGRHAVIRQIAAVMPRRAWGNAIPQRPQIVILPEVTIPLGVSSLLRQTARKEGVTIIGGEYWKQIPNAVKRMATDQTRWFANEALLVFPLGSAIRPVGTLEMNIRKPLPAHQEFALALALSEKYSPTWRILAGTTWYRFVHDGWGPFSLGICSDILDPRPWRSLRGSILHLFLPAHNEDVSLYEALTWTRAYENFVNIVALNHGTKGGSYVWTPRGKHHKQVAQLLGERLLLVADVSLPVKELYEHQQEGGRRAIERAKSQFLDVPSQKKISWKAPPPGFKHRS